eukprot:437246-Hanusia_phi.AAC.1
MNIRLRSRLRAGPQVTTRAVSQALSEGPGHCGRDGHRTGPALAGPPRLTPAQCRAGIADNRLQRNVA